MLTLAVVAIPPQVGAAHMGPCTHEYFDALVYGPKTFVRVAVACATHSVCWVVPCDILA